MFDYSNVVESATSSFNNVALTAPDFFWAAVLCIPIFAAIWMAFDKFSKYSKWFPAITIGSVAIWILSHSSFAALRDYSLIGILTAACLFACTAYLTRRFLEIKDKFKKNRFSFLLPLAVIMIAGICGEPTISGFILSGGAVAIGMTIGWMLHKQNREEYQPNLVAVLLFFTITVGLIMQPEFFRFGKLGELTALHLIFLMAGIAALASNLALRLAGRGRGWLRDSIYKKLKILLRLGELLTAVLFILTESPIAFLAFAAAIMITVWASAKHCPKNDTLVPARDLSWNASLALFGILTAMPVLTCIAIVMWKSSPVDTKLLKKFF